MGHSTNSSCKKHKYLIPLLFWLFALVKRCPIVLDVPFTWWQVFHQDPDWSTLKPTVVGEGVLVRNFDDFSSLSYWWKIGVLDESCEDVPGGFWGAWKMSIFFRLCYNWWFRTCLVVAAVFRLTVLHIRLFAELLDICTHIYVDTVYIGSTPHLGCNRHHRDNYRFRFRTLNHPTDSFARIASWGT